MVDETGVPGENHRQASSHNVIQSTPRHELDPFGNFRYVKYSFNLWYVKRKYWYFIQDVNKFCL